MNKHLKKIRRTMLKRLPEEVKDPIRKVLRVFKKKKGNPAIPAEELKIFDLLKDDFKVVFDIGAREDLCFYEIKHDCKYYLFEPNAKAVESLKRQVSQLKDSDITINEFGLSDKDQDDCVYYEDSQSFEINPFHKASDTGIRYSLRTLDGYLATKNIPHIDFLKIDTEGFDYKIMLGGINTISTKVSYIQFEYWDNVGKFIDLLGDTFDLYLMMESNLLEAIHDEAFDEMSESQKKKNYNLSLIPLDNDIIDLIDRVLAPMGYSGNLFGINKNLPTSTLSRITFPIQ